MTKFEYAGLSGVDNLLICELKCVAVYGIFALIVSCISKISALRQILFNMN